MIPSHPIQAKGTKGSAWALGAKRSSERGSALLAALCFATVLTIALSSYLTVCYRTLQMSTRALQASQAIELAEVGMEDALWALNHSDWSTWTISGTTATKTLSGFSYDNNISGSISLTITSFDGSAGTRTVTARGTTTSPTGATVTRTLTSTSSKLPLFVNAVGGTTGTVRFQSAGTVDSYDSSTGTYAAQTPTYSAVISSGSTLTNSNTVQLTNAQVKGYVATTGNGPSYSTSAKVIGPTTPSTTKIDDSRMSSSPYQPIFTEVGASGSTTITPTHSATIGTPGATTPTQYYSTDIDLDHKDTLTVDGPVILYVSGDVNITDTAKIRVTNNGSLEIHASGAISIGGNGVQNDTLLPKKVAIIGTGSTSGTFTMSAGTDFHGVIYLPNHDLTFTASQTIHGAVVGKSATFSSSPTIHYDTALRNVTFTGINTPYGVSDLRETTN